MTDRSVTDRDAQPFSEATPGEWWEDHATESARAFVFGQMQGMVLDLWMASGRDSLAFDLFCGEHGWPLVWSLLLQEVRGIKPPCMEPTGPDDFCVFDDGHFGPHYGADDVATPVFLPKRAGARDVTTTDEAMP